MTSEKRTQQAVVILVIAMSGLTWVVLDSQFSIWKSLGAFLFHEEPRRRPNPVVSTDFASKSIEQEKVPPAAQVIDSRMHPQIPNSQESQRPEIPTQASEQAGNQTAPGPVLEQSFQSQVSSPALEGSSQPVSVNSAANSSTNSFTNPITSMAPPQPVPETVQAVGEKPPVDEPKPPVDETPPAIALLTPHAAHEGVAESGKAETGSPVSTMKEEPLPSLNNLPVGLAGSRFVRDLGANGVNIATLCPREDMVQAVILQKYGSIFAADRSVKLPTRALFEKPSEVRAFQKSLQLKHIYAQGYPVTLQKAACDAFLAAQKEALAARLKITPVGDIASLRSYEVTAMIWRKYLEKGLQFWVVRHKLTAGQAKAVLGSPPRKQLEAVLAIEKKGLFLHANHIISILNLAAPPGSSQHISGLALDIEEHKSLRVRQIMNRHGWYQTVIRDFPHFLYLGRPAGELGKLGLTQIVNDGHQFWVPDIALP